MLDNLTLDDEQRQALEPLAASARKWAVQPPEMDSLTRSDREYAIEDWLEEQGFAEAWEIAPSLTDINYTTEDLDALRGQFSVEQLQVLFRWLKDTYSVFNLLAEIGQGSQQIAEIVKALKSYTYLDQAPVQSVNIHEGLNNSLLILKSKLKQGIEVRREFDPELPLIEAYGSELNQVWTNLIDNAADALDGQGIITLRTSHDEDGVTVQVEDNGPGIPPDVLPRIFDPFFTTKPIGKGTGMGLDISYNIIVNRHRGEISAKSEPGKTVFTIWVPLQTDGR